MLNHKSILITGGTGSFGKKFVEVILKKYPQIKRLIIYSRDELKQFEMSQVFNSAKYPAIQYYLGDIRDAHRLKRVCEGVDIIIHAAALKQMPTAEYNPMEYIKTNILGAENVINAALDSGVKKVIAISTDKAVGPSSLYGATKLCEEKLILSANYFKNEREISFSVVRYGNFFGSRGSVVPLFMEQRKKGVLSITHKEMTRFSVTAEKGVEFALFALESAWGGEVFVPKLPSYRIMELAQAIGPECELNIIGIRPGEKLHEEMISKADAHNTLEFDNYFVILPTVPIWNVEEYLKVFNGERVASFFEYNSGSNDRFLSVGEIEEEIGINVDMY